MMIFKILFFLVISFYSTVFAELQITSDSLTINSNLLSANFKGSVTVIFKDMIIKANNLKIFYNDPNNKKTISKIEIPGRLKAIKKCTNEVIVANHGEYITGLQQLILTGDVAIERDGRVIVTNKMIYLTTYKTHSNELDK